MGSYLKGAAGVNLGGPECEQAKTNSFLQGFAQNEVEDQDGKMAKRLLVSLGCEQATTISVLQTIAQNTPSGKRAPFAAPLERSPVVWPLRCLPSAFANVLSLERMADSYKKHSSATPASKFSPPAHNPKPQVNADLEGSMQKTNNRIGKTLLPWNRPHPAKSDAVRRRI